MTADFIISETSGSLLTAGPNDIMNRYVTLAAQTHGNQRYTVHC